MVTLNILFTGFFVTAAARLAAMPLAGLLRDVPQSGAAAEIAGRLLLPQAAAARNSQNDRKVCVILSEAKDPVWRR
ncbi:MAG: hypothetical protein ACI3VA_12410 [Candidatus Limivicinus sp.]